MKPYKFTLIILLITSCSSQKLLRHERGELIFGGTELVEKKGLPSYEVDISRGKSQGQAFLILKPYKSIPIESNWVDIYQENAIYEKIPFFSGEAIYDTKPTKNMIEVRESKTSHLKESFDLPEIKMSLNNKIFVGKRAIDNTYIIPLQDLPFMSKESTTAKIELDGKIVDISSQINFEKNKYQSEVLKEQAKPTNRYKLPMCSSGYTLIEIAFDPLVRSTPISNCIYELYPRGFPAGANVMQSVHNGVLVNFPQMRSGRVIFIKTKKPLVDNDYVPNMYLKYSGVFRYESAIGAIRSIHSFEELDDSSR